MGINSVLSKRKNDTLLCVKILKSLLNFTKQGDTEDTDKGLSVNADAQYMEDDRNAPFIY